jgi:uncharacterized protein (TIGR04255 family)
VTVANLQETEKRRLHFENPPIIEAVIAFTIAPLPETAVAAFRECATEMKELGYSKSGPVVQHQFQAKPEMGQSSVSSVDSPVGVKFVSDDSLHAVQFNRTGFVFSRLGRYDRWEQLRDEGRKLWNLFERASGQPKIVTIGVRFINKLFLPLNENPSDYVRALPEIPEEVAPAINEMFMRIVSEIDSPPGRFIHNQALLPPEKEGFSTVLFDNDFQFPVEGKSQAEIWEMLESIREIKDAYFVNLTTDKMRATFDA